MRKLLVLLMALAGLCYAANAQVYKFQRYDISRGLCHQFVYSIAQDRHGFIWFATGLGLCRFDGFRFTSPEGDLPSSNVTASFSDSRGDLWFGYQNGIIVKYDGNEFAVADTVSSTAVVQIIQAPDGEILAATQTGGITRIGRKIDRIEAGFEDMMINTICFSGNDRLMVGAYDGLYLYHYDSDPKNITPVAKDDIMADIAVKHIAPKIGGGYWVATESDGIYHVTVNDEDRFSTMRLDIPVIDEAQVQSVYEDVRGHLWVSTFGGGLFSVQLSDEMYVLKTAKYDANSSIESDYVKQVFTDRQQNIWVATYGQGVASITHPSFSFFETLDAIANNATAVFSADNSEYWIAGDGKIIRIADNSQQTVWGNSEGLPNDRITVLRIDSEGDLWIGTETSGLYRLDKKTGKVSLFYREENSLSNTVHNFVFADGKIWMATRNGVLIIDAQTGEKTEERNTFDGGLPHNDIQDIFKDSKDRIWIATHSNALIDVKNGSRLTVPDDSETEFSAIDEDETGRIWAATYGKGVYLFDETRDTTWQFTAEDDLKTDYCYAIASDDNGHVWIGHRLGLTCINTNRLSINTFGIDNGIHGDVNPRAMMLNKNNEMLIGTTDGVMMYNIESSSQETAGPMLNLSRLLINDVPYNTHQPVILPYGRYKVQFDFVGLQYSSPNAVSYQYLLQGMDMEWSTTSKSNTTFYHRLENGEYNFWVKACNSDNCTEETMLFSIKIRNPYWKSWWFVLLMILLVIGLGYIVIAIRERNHRRQQEYLENELKARTREVRKQKEEIEIKNRDITDSINYAQRIQFSVLPSTSTLLEHCSDAFIFYRPRDIVSGDFYWFDYFPGTHRLLIVCADSTGHGVPGAFMSLIGTTLIKDIVMRSDIHNPADILYRLDENIQSTLNQNRDSEQANDGMDIIVCEINTETYLTKISSAMRPYVIYHDGTAEVFKSSRSSIGGQNIDDKIFSTHEIQLSKGDNIYMFTDGYADQFGGPSGKKLKLNRLQNILDDVHSRDMDEQHRVIRENFDLWKGDIPQVDDVLLIGVKL